MHVRLKAALAGACLLALTGTAAAQADRSATPAPAPTTSIQLQTNTGASCSAPAVGNCGSCAISCPTGQAAMCKPGLAVGKGAAGDSCLQTPECSCR